MFMFLDELLCVYCTLACKFLSYILILVCSCKRISYPFCFLILQSHDACEENTEGSYITSQQLLLTPENLKKVEIQRQCPYSDTREHEISKLFSDWGTVVLKTMEIQSIS